MMRRLIGLYALHLYLPASRWSQKVRVRRATPRARNRPGLHPTRLPEIGWKEVTRGLSTELWESRKANGNIRISELAILTSLAAEAPRGSTLLEIGTFDGRTTLNLAMNAPPCCPIVTVDLPPEETTRHALAAGERHMVDKPTPGKRFRQYAASHPLQVERIEQRLGDSAKLDFRSLFGCCSLVFVDGSHAYENVRADSATATKLAQPGGHILWHDYGIWPETTRALEELESERGLGLRSIAGTSLVVWQKP